MSNSIYIHIPFHFFLLIFFGTNFSSSLTWLRLRIRLFNNSFGQLVGVTQLTYFTELQLQLGGFGGINYTLHTGNSATRPMEPGIAKAGLTSQKLPQPHAPAFAKVSSQGAIVSFAVRGTYVARKLFGTRYYFSRFYELRACWLRAIHLSFLLFLPIVLCIFISVYVIFFFFYFTTFFRYVSLSTNGAVVSRHCSFPRVN